MLLKGKPPLPRAPTPELQPQAPLTLRDPQIGLHLGGLMGKNIRNRLSLFHDLWNVEKIVAISLQ